MGKHKNNKIVSKAGSVLATSKSKTAKKVASKVLTNHKKKKHN